MSLRKEKEKRENMTIKIPLIFFSHLRPKHLLLMNVSHIYTSFISPFLCIIATIINTKGENKMHQRIMCIVFFSFLIFFITLFRSIKQKNDKKWIIGKKMKTEKIERQRAKWRCRERKSKKSFSYLALMRSFPKEVKITEKNMKKKSWMCRSLRE